MARGVEEPTCEEEGECGKERQGAMIDLGNVAFARHKTRAIPVREIRASPEHAPWAYKSRASEVANIHLVCAFTDP